MTVPRAAPYCHSQETSHEASFSRPPRPPSLSLPLATGSGNDGEIKVDAVQTPLTDQGKDTLFTVEIVKARDGGYAADALKVKVTTGWKRRDRSVLFVHRRERQQDARRRRQAWRAVEGAEKHPRRGHRGKGGQGRALRDHRRVGRARRRRDVDTAQVVAARSIRHTSAEHGRIAAVGAIASLDTLRCFVAAARALNFRQAARSVALGPTAFSQRIKSLEEQLGRQLFSRTTRSVTLTSAGLALLPAAEHCLEAVAQCERIGDGTIAHAPTSLTIGTRQELGMSWLLPQRKALLRERPWLEIHLHFSSGPDLLLRVRTLGDRLRDHVHAVQRSEARRVHAATRGLLRLRRLGAAV